MPGDFAATVDINLTPYSLPSLAGALGMAALAGHAWRRAGISGRLFAIMAAVSALWALGHVLEVASAGLDGKVWWLHVQTAAMAALPVLWLVFVLAYTGREQWLNVRRGLLLAVLPAFTLLLIFTNSIHGLVWARLTLETAGALTTLNVEPGPWYWVHLAYSYSLNVLGALLLVLALLRAPRFYRRQGLTLLGGLSLPWLVSLFYVLGWASQPEWNLAPAFFAPGALIITWGIIHFKLLDLLPVARDNLVDASGDGLMVLDGQDRVVDLNPAAQRILERRSGEGIGQNVRELLSQWPENKPQPGANADGDALLKPSQTEVAIGPPDTRVYDLSISPLVDKRGLRTGWLVALRDISERKRAEAEQQAQKQLFENLVAVARATSQGTTLAATLQNALDVAATLTGAERGSLFMLDEAGLVTHSLVTYSDIRSDQRQVLVRRVMDRGLSGWVARQREGVLIADTRHDSRWLSSPNDVFPIASAMGVPILGGGMLAGVMTLSHSQANRFTEEHLRLLQAAADQMALALRNAQMFDSQRLMAQRQAALYGVLRAVGEQHTPEGVARAAVQAIMRLVGSQAGWLAAAIALPDRDRQHWVLYTAREAGDVALAPPVPMGQGIIGSVFASGQALVDFGEPDGDAGGRAVLTAPMRQGGRVLGVLRLESAHREPLSNEDRQLADSLADAVALALDNANLYQAIADESGRLQSLIKSSRDGILMLSTERRVLVLNAAAMDLLSLPGAPNAWLGQPMAAVLFAQRRAAPSMARAMLAEMRRLVRGDEPPADGEMEAPPRSIAWLSLPVLAGAQPLGRLWVLRDITEERLVIRMREDLTDTMVHDLRNPLNNIRMALELLSVTGQTAPGSGQDEVFEIAQASTERMLNLVNAILDVSRLESGQMPLAHQTVQLRQLAEAGLQAQRLQASGKRQTLENAVSDALPEVVVDGGLIRRVLQNLLDNAAKFTPEGGRISVSAQAREGWVQMTVRDTGPGLPPEILRGSFQKFVTGRHQEERGSGLGLAFCRLAVEAHGGRFWADSAPGQGTAFHFTLPQSAPQRDRAEISAAEPHNPG